MQRALVLRIGIIKRRCKRGRIRIDNLNAPRKGYSFNVHTGGLLHDIPYPSVPEKAPGRLA